MINKLAKSLADSVGGMLCHRDAHAHALGNMRCKTGNIGSAAREHDTEIKNVKNILMIILLQ